MARKRHRHYRWGSKPKAERGEGRATPNTVRTLCVRTCDGYYFPISFSTTKKYFEADEATCQRLCPAGDASLYYHSRRQGPEQMVSIAGTPYSDLENAFRYRTVLDRSCTCGTPLPISEPAEIVLADYSDEPATPSASEEDSQTLTSLLSTPTFTASVISNAPTEAPIALQPDFATPLPTRIILATGSAEQDRLVVSSAPEKWFQEDPGVSYLRGPGDIACLSRGPPAGLSDRQKRERLSCATTRLCSIRGRDRHNPRSRPSSRRRCLRA